MDRRIVTKRSERDDDILVSVDESRLLDLRRFFEERPRLGVASVYLYGSHAEGRAHLESDVDLAVLLDWNRYPTSAERFDVRVRLGSELISVLGTNDVDLVVLNDLPPLFGRRIVYEGKRVVLGNPEADRNYTLDIQLQAADLAPWLERMNRLKIEALKR